MAQTKIKSGQLDLSGAAHGTDGQALLSNADGTMRWGDIQVAGPGFTSLDYPGTTTALIAAGGQTLIINGSGYDANTTVTFGTTSVSSISVLSATQLSVTTPALANGTYDLVLGNAAGGTTTQSNAIIYNATPSWTTAAGSLGSVAKNATANFTVAATEPDGGTITYAVTSGALPTGLSLNTSSGAITGTATPSISSNTTYNFTITATDNENQTNARAFSIEVTVPLPSESFEAITYTGNGGTQKIEGGKILRGAEFNGSNSYITTGYTAVSSTAASISLWVNINSYTNYGGFAIDSTGAGNPVRLAIGQGSGTSGNLWISMGNGSTSWYQDPAASLTSYGLNNWFHLVVTVDGTTVKLYINGSLINTFTSSISYAGAGVGPYYLGGWGSSLLLNGKLDQVRFFNKAVSSSEVTTLYQEDDYTSTTKSTTDIFGDGSCKALYELEANANATGSVPEIAFDSTINTSSIAYTVNNRKIAGNTSGSYKSTRVTESKSSGKWYFEMYYNDSSYFPSSRSGLGLLCPTCAMTTYLGGLSQDDWAVFNGGNVINNGSSVHNESLGDFSAGNVIMCALDLDNQKVYFGKNGTWFNSANPSNGTNSFTLSGSEYYAAGWVYNTSDQLTFRFRERDFSYTVPTGFSAYSEANYDGTASNITFKEGTKFSPDLVWIKQRTGTANHILFDSVRGAFKQISSSATYGQVDRTSADKGVVSFDTKGFTLKDASGGDYEVNGPNGGQYSGNGTYVAWCFKAGGTKVANTDGNLTGTVNVSANTGSGFSIVEFTSESGSGKTAGHGLGVAPKLVIFKRLDTSESWFAFTTEGDGSHDYLILNSSAAKADATEAAPTDSVITQPTTASGRDYIAYCFHDVAGYQKIGGYNGDGTTSGHVIETGFEPALVIIKGVSHGGSWVMLDNERSTTNPRDEVIYADASGAEGVNDTYVKANFLSNGFELKTNDSGINMSGRTYIYLAIAADPDITQPTQANSFGIVAFTGNRPSTQDLYLGFKPDLIWIKNRDSASYPHVLTDSVRGNTKFLESNSTNAENSTSNGITSFNDNGFSLGSDGYFNGGASGANNNMIAWCWKAADHDDSLPTINTTGTIDSVVSANQNAGFSIVKYTANGTAGATIGHGLSSAPELIIVKHLNGTSNWPVYVTGLSAVSKYLYLNTSDAETSSSNPDEFHSTAPTSTVFSIGLSGNTNTNGGNYIAYCWHSVTGYSKIGSYQGNSSSGNSVNVGFRPRFVVIKGIDSASNWIAHTAVDGMNGADHLRWNTTGAEDNGANEAISFTDTGFSITTSGATQINTNGEDYVYMAFK